MTLAQRQSQTGTWSGSGPETGKNGQARAPGSPVDARLQALLMFEAELRRQKTPLALSLWVVNELRQVLEYSQCILFRLTKNGQARAEAVSGLAQVDRNAPFVRWVEGRAQLGVDQLQAVRLDHDRSMVIDLALSETASPSDEADKGHGQETVAQDVYPFQCGVFFSLKDRYGQLFGGVLLARTKPWSHSEKVICERLAETIAHSFQALLPPRKLRRWSLSGKLVAGAAVLGMLTMFIPVPMTALAPVEIIADAPEIVAAPIDGVIEKIMPDANQTVQAGDVLFSFENTDIKANAEILHRKALVSVAKLATAKQAAFSDAQVHRQLAIAEAEVNLAQAERKFAEQKLHRTIVRAHNGGQLIYSSRKDWVGKPVKTGERVMEIANPARVVAKILLPVSDAITLKPGARVRVFLDANPLAALDGRLRHASYQAGEFPGVGLAFELIAELSNRKPAGQTAVRPRIGLRGTAQIIGDEVFLGFYLFRRPISSLRQYLGI